MHKNVNYRWHSSLLSNHRGREVMCRWLKILQKWTAISTRVRLTSLALLLAGFLSFLRDDVIAQEAVPPEEFIARLEEALKAQDRYFSNVGMRIEYHKVSEFAENPPGR